MLRNDILDLINKFEKETWKYDFNDKLVDDMQYIYLIENDIEKINEKDLKPMYDRLIAIIGIIRFKYGFESVIIQNNREFEYMKQLLNKISLDSNDIISQYNYISTIYYDYINKNKNLDYIENEFKNMMGKEGIYIAIESLKSLITNDEYRQFLGENQINDILIDCIKLNNNKTDIRIIESKYQDIIKKIWEQSLSNVVYDGSNFRILFSNISGGNLRDQAHLLMNRPEQSSCSMISSHFIATYGSNTRRIGFIYPNNSEIIMASTYDLNSNVFGLDSRNREKGTLLATPDVIEKQGILMTQEKGEDLYSSSCYNEVLVSSKPCGIVVIGLGENDLNIDYQDAKMLSLELNLPLYNIDTMQYKDNLSDFDKYYIAFHSVLSFLEISTDDFYQICYDDSQIYQIIDTYKEQIADIFVKLKRNGNLSKENMCQLMSNVVDISKFNGKSK